MRFCSVWTRCQPQGRARLPAPYAQTGERSRNRTLPSRIWSPARLPWNMSARIYLLRILMVITVAINDTRKHTIAVIMHFMISILTVFKFSPGLSFGFSAASQDSARARFIGDKICHTHDQLHDRAAFTRDSLYGCRMDGDFLFGFVAFWALKFVYWHYLNPM